MHSFLTADELSTGRLTTDRLTELVEQSTKANSYFDSDLTTLDAEPPQYLVVVLQLPGKIPLRVTEVGAGAWTFTHEVEEVDFRIPKEKTLFDIVFSADSQAEYKEPMPALPTSEARIIQINPIALLRGRRAA